MYGETGSQMRAALARLLRQRRVQQRLGGAHDERAVEIARILRYRHTILAWCHDALRAADPVLFTNLPVREPNPFRTVNVDGAAGLLRHELETALAGGNASRAVGGPAGLALLTTPSQVATVEAWRHAARAAALAEHDTVGELARAMTAPQAQALAGDVAAVTQALVVLDQRYRSTPGWQPLPNSARLGWAALATALDVGLGRPDYAVDRLGWRPKTKPIDGPARSGALGVLQAEHNLLVRLKTFPHVTNLRYIVDSQRRLSHDLVPRAGRIDPRFADRWRQRAETYAQLQRQLRGIGGRIGQGGYAAAEGANAVARLAALPGDVAIEPRVLGAFQTLFDRVDERIADVIETGIDTCRYLARATVPRLVADSGTLVSPVRERYVPIDRTTHHDLIDTVRNRLRPASATHQPASPGLSRTELGAALVNQPARREPRPTGRSL